jgi:polysaccharide biosynthesis protein PslH
MKSLRIIVAMIEPPLPFGNAAARWYYVLLRGLVERGHRVTAFAACSKPEEIAKATALFPAPRYDLRLYPLPIRRGLRAKWETYRRPYSYMFSPEFKRDLEQELIHEYDVLHLEQLWCGWVGLKHAAKALVNVHHLQWIDLEEVNHSTWRGRREARVIAATERRLLRRFHFFRSCSPRLAPEILRINPTANVTTVPVGIDATQYPYIPDESRTTEPVISVIGSMGWYPTHSAAIRLLTRLWPEIKKRAPTARVQIVGWNARSALKEFIGAPDVAIEENVPDIRPYFERTGVMLYAPGRGSGMKIKILEAMAFGVPVVTTSEGIEGLPAIDGVHAGVSETDAGLIDRTVKLLVDRDLQNKQRRAGRELLEQHCGPNCTVGAIEDIYVNVTALPSMRLGQCPSRRVL